MQCKTRDNYLSYAVQTRRGKVPDLIRYMYTRALMIEATRRVSPASPWAREKMREEFYRRVATLMLLDMYSAMHPFDSKEELVELTPRCYPEDQISSWWHRYHLLSPDDLIDLIWVEVKL